MENITKIYIDNVNGAIKYSKVKKHLLMCNECYKLLQKEDIREVISPNIYIFYTENQEYRVCTSIDRYFAESIFREENVKDRTGKVSKETLSIYLNSKTL